VLKSGVVVPIGLKSFIAGRTTDQDMNETARKTDVAVAGDVLGHLIGTLSQMEGTLAVVDTVVEVNGCTPLGPWSRMARTDENGFFSVDLPLGSLGPIIIHATIGGQRTTSTIESDDIAVSLTPRSQSPNGRVTLEGRWDFAVDPPPPGANVYAASVWPEPSDPGTWNSIDVPSHWEMEGFKAQTGSAVYRRFITIPDAWQGKRIKFRSEGVYSRAEVWVNRKRVGGHDGGSTPFELDITDVARPGAENIICILARESSDAGNLDGNTYCAHLNMGGIWRPLELFSVEKAHISRLVITTDFDESYQDAELSADLVLVNEQAKDVRGCSVKLECIDPKGKAVFLRGLPPKVSLGPWERKRVTLRMKVTRPRQWSAETPWLYKLRVELEAPTKSPATVEQPFGFRKVEIKGRTFLINGKPIKIWGAGRLDSHPLMGRAITREIARQDVELMKATNLNGMRTTTYLQHPAAFDASDELGLYVEDEGPFNFVSVGYGPPTGRKRNLSEDLRLAPLIIGETSEMLERDRNRPSVVIWSICNESVFGRNFHMLHAFVRGSDPTRPTSAGQSANLEIATYHNPTSMKRIKDTADFQMPVLFDEAFCIFQGFGAQAQGLELDPGLRDFWISPHFEPFEAILKSDHHFGTQIWAWVDDAFLAPGRGIEYGRMKFPKSHVVDSVYGMPGRGIVGEPMWGMIEGWRRVRPECWLAKKLFSPIHIKEEPLEPTNPIRVPVENRNFFTDLNGYVCKWRLNEETGEIRQSIPPQATGTITINPLKAPDPHDTLTLEFFDDHGELIDGYKLAFHPPDIPAPRLSGKPARIVNEPGEMALMDCSNVSFVSLVGVKCALAFDRCSGGLIRGIADNQLVLLAGPQLHIMKSYAVLESYPADWHVTDQKYETDKGRAILHWNGSYSDQFTGGFVIRMDDAGNIEIEYRFRYIGLEMLAREIGLGLEVPLSCDRLEWQRRAEWSYYPDDHIGRPHGVAVTHPKVPQTTPPNRPFGLDDHVWGCNDFRGVKRNVYWATLTGPGGSGIRVLSDGHQHVRATVSVHSIGVKILDYYGGSATGADEWDGAYGNGHAIRTGDMLKGTVRLELLPEKAAIS
jgi:hypothetical protein